MAGQAVASCCVHRPADRLAPGPRRPLHGRARARPRRHGHRLPGATTSSMTATWRSRCFRPSSDSPVGPERFSARDPDSPRGSTIRTSCRCTIRASASEPLYFVMPVHRWRVAARSAWMREGPLPIDDALRLVARWPTRSTTPTGTTSSTATSSRRTSCCRGRCPGRRLRDRAGGRRGAGRRLTEPVSIVGTPAVHEPRAGGRRADVDARIDLYSLGLRALRDAGGRAPFTGPRRRR